MLFLVPRWRDVSVWSVKNAEYLTRAGEMFPLLIRPGHVTPQNVRGFVKQDRQMTRDNSVISICDQCGEAVGVNERVDRFPIFHAIERRDVHRQDVTSDK